MRLYRAFLYWEFTNLHVWHRWLRARYLGGGLLQLTQTYEAQHSFVTQTEQHHNISSRCHRTTVHHTVLRLRTYPVGVLYTLKLCLNPINQTLD